MDVCFLISAMPPEDHVLSLILRSIDGSTAYARMVLSAHKRITKVAGKDYSFLLTGC